MDLGEVGTFCDGVRREHGIYRLPHASREPLHGRSNQRAELKEGRDIQRPLEVTPSHMDPNPNPHHGPIQFLTSMAYPYQYETEVDKEDDIRRGTGDV